MQQAITVLPTSPQSIAQSARPHVDPTLWLTYFDPTLALQDVINYIETLPGSRHERHTMRAYLMSLAAYCRFLGADVIHYNGEDYDWDFSTMHMPSHQRTGDFIAHCSRQGLSSNTIQRYMAAVRHFIRALDHQEMVYQNGMDFMFILEAQRQFRLASEIKNPAPDRTSNRPALEQHGTRLDLIETNTLFAGFKQERDTLAGKRDLALLYLGITSGLRAAELSRITLNTIRRGDDCYEVVVRGKRNNFDPVGIDNDAYALIMDFVTTWNNALPADEIPLSAGGEGLGEGSRYITGDIPVFQPVNTGDRPWTLGAHGYHPANGISSRAILKIVERRTQAILSNPITAHDMRRTCAYLMRAHGYEWDQIRAQLRHRSIGTTEKYVGQAQDLSKALLSKRVTFTLPHDNTQNDPDSSLHRNGGSRRGEEEGRAGEAQS